ncbi:mRNA interferase MazF [Desulfitispora alkaliphila]|uniref:type II toxin-antitoxin system PemK/MazF family toxin n=1 Tax=Desulfitispora alkaliphila TaxID=622674 RepID=UPI003D22DA92
MLIKRGDVFYAQLNPVVGSEQGGLRPVLIVQNNIGNQYSPTTIVSAITSQISKAKLPTHIELKAHESGLEKDSVILTEQIRTIDKSRLTEKITTLNEETIKRVDKALEISLGVVEI